MDKSNDDAVREISPEDSGPAKTDSIVRKTLTESQPEGPGTSEVPSLPTENGPVTDTTYGSCSWLLAYFKMFTLRLGTDVYISLQQYFYPNTGVPQHIAQLLADQRSLHSHRDHAQSSCRYKMQKSPCFDNRASLHRFTAPLLSDTAEFSESPSNASLHVNGSFK